MSGEHKGRIEELVARADKLRIEGKRRDAYSLAREALSVDSRDPSVQRLLQDLQDPTTATTLVKACEDFTTSWDKVPGKLFRDRLEELGSIFDYEQAKHCLDLLLDRRCPDDNLALLVGDCLKNLLGLSHSAKQALVTRCIDDVTFTFERCWEMGEASFHKLLAVFISRDELWSSKDEWSKAVQGAFQLSLAKLIDAGEDNTEWALNAILLLSKEGQEVIKDLVDMDTFAILLDNLDIHAPQSSRRSALIATKLLLDITGDEGEKYLKQYVTGRVGKGTTDDLIHAFSAASSTFSLLPGPAAKLFLTEGFLQSVVTKLQRNMNSKDGRSVKLELSALELISTACRDKACRDLIAKIARTWLDDVVQISPTPESRAQAALILAKIYNAGSSSRSDTAAGEAEYLSSLLINMMFEADANRLARHAIEALSYLSLEPKVKEMIAHSERLLQKLISLLSTKTDDNDMGDFEFAFGYGIMMLVSNVVQYRKKQSEEERRMQQLKAYSEHQRPNEEDPLDDDKHAEARGRLVVATEIVPAILAKVQGMKDKNLGFASGIILSLANDKKNRARLAQQGAIKSLLQIYVQLKALPSNDHNDQSIINTSHALARILISLNPNHAFGSALPATTVIRPLVDLLNLNDALITLLATFESLLALTNIASMDDTSAREAIIRSSFSSIEHLLLYNNIPIQRAAMELICNSMALPSTVALFADGSANAKRRMHLLLALTDAPDLATRSAAGGALAMLVEYEPGVEAVLERENGVKMILGLCEEEGDGAEGLIHRGLAVVDIMTDAEGEVGKKAKEKVKEAGGVEIVKGALRRTRNGEVLSIGVGVLKKLA